MTDAEAANVAVLCERCGSELTGGSEQLAGMCLKCLNYVNDPTCQGYAP